MKPPYRETSCDASGRIVTILLFVITLMSFLFISVPARCAIQYMLQTWIGTCPGCDLTAHPCSNLYLNVPVPTANTIECSTLGSTSSDQCGVASISDEHAKASGFVFYGTMGVSLFAEADTTPPYYSTPYFDQCATIKNPAKPQAHATANFLLSDKLTMAVPGVPIGTPIELQVTKVWEIVINTDNPVSALGEVSISITDFSGPARTFTYEGSGKGSDSPFRHTEIFTYDIENGSSHPVSIEFSASADVSAGWLPSSGLEPQWVPSGTSTVTAMNTLAYYIDVLTPGASYSTESGTIYPTSDSVHLDVSLAGTGSGTVKSSPAGIDCGLTCSSHYLPGTTIAFTAVPATDGSIFSGWSGNPTCTKGSVFMTTTKTCTATFDLCPGTTRAQIGSTNNYDSISLAYGGAATDGDTIKVLASNQQEGPINFNSGKSVALTGGYDCSFNNVVSYTVVTGSITIVTGDVTIGNIVIL